MEPLYIGVYGGGVHYILGVGNIPVCILYTMANSFRINSLSMGNFTQLHGGYSTLMVCPTLAVVSDAQWLYHILCLLPGKHGIPDALFYCAGTHASVEDTNEYVIYKFRPNGLLLPSRYYSIDLAVPYSSTRVSKKHKAFRLRLFKTKSRC